MIEDDFTEICDRLQDISRSLNFLVKAMQEEKQPDQITLRIEPGDIAAPDVNVSAPSVSVPVNVEAPKAFGRIYTVLSRDKDGNIKEFQERPLIEN